MTANWPWSVALYHDVRAAPSRIGVFGLGRIGKRVAERVIANPGVNLVAAWDRGPALMGRELSSVLSNPVTSQVKVTAFEAYPWGQEPLDVVIYAGSDNLAEAEQHLLTCVRNRAHVVGLTVALSFPWARHPEIADRLDQAARQAGVTILGTGVNPGFLSDVLLLGLASSSTDVQEVSLDRTNDLSDQSTAQLDARSIGVPLREFERRLAGDRVKVHTGFEESAALLARGLGWDLTHITRNVDPIVASASLPMHDREIGPGCVAGTRTVGLAYQGARLRIRIQHTHVAAPRDHGLRTEDYIRIRGNPPINLRIRPEVEGAGATAAMAVNAIAALSQAPRGMVLVGA